MQQVDAASTWLRAETAKNPETDAIAPAAQLVAMLDGERETVVAVFEATFPLQNGSDGPSRNP